MRNPITMYGLVLLAAAALGVFGPDPFKPLYDWVHYQGGLIAILSKMGAVL